MNLSFLSTRIHFPSNFIIKYEKLNVLLYKGFAFLKTLAWGSR